MLTKAGYRHALDWLRGVQPGATANGSDFTLAGLIADELDRLTARNRELDACHDALKELLTCAGLCGVSLPVWTERMQAAWDNGQKVVNAAKGGGEDE